MNIGQRVVLTAAAVGVVGVLLFTPRVEIMQDSVLAAEDNEFADLIDVRTVVASVLAIVAAAGLLFLALSDRTPDARLRKIEAAVAALAGDIVAVEAHLTDPPPPAPSAGGERRVAALESPPLLAPTGAPERPGHR